MGSKMYMCPICGLGRGKQFSHEKCSKILQGRNKLLNKQKATKRGKRKFNAKGMEIFINHVANNKE